MTGKYQSIFVGNTNLFSSGSAMVLIVPKSVIEKLNIDVENKKAHFEIYVNNKSKEITYKLTKESDK